ncbi:hypothetical protein TWF506_011091 [Arthrobotrys conoides]|uniref:Uncharacterized protein n=1 Tax=Arthrobotrys conoides TaxID=74498 RepID=A0AAN8N0K2_9PEZI
MSSSMRTPSYRGHPRQEATAGSTPGPIRRRPQNGLMKHLVSSPYTATQVVRDNGNRWLPTLNGILRVTTGTVGTLATVGGVVGRVGHAATRSFFSYVSKSTKSYMGWDTAPAQPMRTSLTDGSLHEEQDRRYRERAAAYYESQDREAEEARRESERAAEVRALGNSLQMVSPQAPQVSSSWTEELRKTGPAHTVDRQTEETKHEKGSKSQKATSKPTRERGYPYRQHKRNDSGFKAEFQENFKSDPSKDAEKLAFLQSYTGWKPSFFRNQASVFQRLPKLPDDFDILGDTDHTENIVRLAEIISDRGFLKRHNIVCDITFEPVWGRKPIGDAAIAALQKVYIPEDQFEPEPAYQPREFSEEEREKMKINGDFSAVRKEFKKQTIYDLIFHTPYDHPLPAVGIELPDEEFEVSRDDPRFRQLWQLLPSVRLPGNLHLLEANAKTRLAYKKMVSRRDHWFWKVIQEVRKRDRYLAKVYDHFDLNRKRSEMNWDEFRRVHVIRSNNPPANRPEKAQEVPHQSVDKHRKMRKASVSPERPPVQQYDPEIHTKHRIRHNRALNSGTSTKCWINQEMDLSDEDNFPSKRTGRSRYTAQDAEYQGKRLARAIEAQAETKPKPKPQPKKVTFAPGHTLRVFEQEESDASRTASPADTHASKKMKATGETSIRTAQTSAGPGQRKRTGLSMAPSTFTKPKTVGEGSSDPIHASYQKSLVDVPREWRQREDTGTFSAWEEDSEEAGVFYEIDIVDGKLPKGRGSWQTELEQTSGPKRVRIIRSNGTSQDFAVWSQDGILRDLDWVPSGQQTEEEKERARLEEEVAEFKRMYPNLPTPEVEALPDLKTAFQNGYTSPKNEAERIRMYRIMAATKDKVKGPKFRAATDEEAARWGPDSTFEETARMHQRAREMDEREAALKKEEERLAQLRAELTKAQELPNILKKRRRSSDHSPTKSPTKSTEITGEFPRFNPFEAVPAQAVESPTKSSRSLLSPPLSNEDDASGKEENAPGSKAKARLTGLFDPVQSQKVSGFTVVEDARDQGNGDNVAGTNDVFRPIVNGATLPRLGSAGDIPKAQSLLPSAPITAAPATPSAITPAEAGMFASVRPSLKNEMSLDEGSSMELDNTPQSAKKIKSPKEFGFVTDAATTLAETFKPVVPASFEFGAMSKPNFGAGNTTSGKSFALGAPTSNPFAGNTSFQFGAAAAAAPSIFGVSTTAEKPSESVFTFGGNSKPAAKKAPEVFNFGGPSTTPAAAPPKTDIFNFGGKATTTAAPSFFGAPTAAPSAPVIFGATSNAPTTNALFGATSGATTAPSFTAAPTSFNFGEATSAPAFGGNNGATSSASFTFGSTATTQPVQFGAELPKQTSASFGETFTFGAKTEAPPSFGFNATSAPASTTTAAPIFGGLNAATSVSNAPTSFPADSANNMFGFQPPAANPHGRTIKAPVSRKPGSVRGRR